MTSASAIAHELSRALHAGDTRRVEHLCAAVWEQARGCRDGRDTTQLTTSPSSSPSSSATLSSLPPPHAHPSSQQSSYTPKHSPPTRVARKAKEHKGGAQQPKSLPLSSSSFSSSTSSSSGPSIPSMCAVFAAASILTATSVPTTATLVAAVPSTLPPVPHIKDLYRLPSDMLACSCARTAATALKKPTIALAALQVFEVLLTLEEDADCAFASNHDMANRKVTFLLKCPDLLPGLMTLLQSASQLFTSHRAENADALATAASSTPADSATVTAAVTALERQVKRTVQTLRWMCEQGTRQDVKTILQYPGDFVSILMGMCAAALAPTSTTPTSDRRSMQKMMSDADMKIALDVIATLHAVATASFAPALVRRGLVHHLPLWIPLAHHALVRPLLSLFLVTTTDDDVRESLRDVTDVEVPKMLNTTEGRLLQMQAWVRFLLKEVAFGNRWATAASSCGSVGSLFTFPLFPAGDVPMLRRARGAALTVGRVLRSLLGQHEDTTEEELGVHRDDATNFVQPHLLPLALLSCESRDVCQSHSPTVSMTATSSTSHLYVGALQRSSSDAPASSSARATTFRPTLVVGSLSSTSSDDDMDSSSAPCSGSQGSSSRSGGPLSSSGSEQGTSSSSDDAASPGHSMELSSSNGTHEGELSMFGGMVASCIGAEGVPGSVDNSHKLGKDDNSDKNTRAPSAELLEPKRTKTDTTQLHDGVVTSTTFFSQFVGHLPVCQPSQSLSSALASTFPVTSTFGFGRRSSSSSSINKCSAIDTPPFHTPILSAPGPGDLGLAYTSSPLFGGLHSGWDTVCGVPGAVLPAHATSAPVSGGSRSGSRSSVFAAAAMEGGESGDVQAKSDAHASVGRASTTSTCTFGESAAVTEMASMEADTDSDEHVDVLTELPSSAAAAARCAHACAHRGRLWGRSTFDATPMEDHEEGDAAFTTSSTSSTTSTTTTTTTSTTTTCTSVKTTMSSPSPISLLGDMLLATATTTTAAAFGEEPAAHHSVASSDGVAAAGAGGIAQQGHQQQPRSSPSRTLPPWGTGAWRVAVAAMVDWLS